MLPLIVALVGAFVGSLCLFGGLVVHVPNNQDFEFKDRLRAYLASSPYGDLIESTDLACSFISCALYIGGTYLSNEPEWMSTLELAFAIFFAVNFFFCLAGSRETGPVEKAYENYRNAPFHGEQSGARPPPCPGGARPCPGLN